MAHRCRLLYMSPRRRGTLLASLKHKIGAQRTKDLKTLRICSLYWKVSYGMTFVG